jgi:hypothetical protein
MVETLLLTKPAKTALRDDDVCVWLPPSLIERKDRLPNRAVARIVSDLSG